MWWFVIPSSSYHNFLHILFFISPSSHGNMWFRNHTLSCARPSLHVYTGEPFSTIGSSKLLLYILIAERSSPFSVPYGQHLVNCCSGISTVSDRTMAWEEARISLAWRVCKVYSEHTKSLNCRFFQSPQQLHIRLSRSISANFSDDAKSAAQHCVHFPRCLHTSEHSIFRHVSHLLWNWKIIYLMWHSQTRFPFFWACLRRLRRQSISFGKIDTTKFAILVFSIMRKRSRWWNDDDKTNIEGEEFQFFNKSSSPTFFCSTELFSICRRRCEEDGYWILITLSLLRRALALSVEQFLI